MKRRAFLASGAAALAAPLLPALPTPIVREALIAELIPPVDPTHMVDAMLYGYQYTRVWFSVSEGRMMQSSAMIDHTKWSTEE